MLMRLCERDGSFDFAAYDALTHRITFDEALRINAALVVIGDERAAYSEWRASDKGKAAPRHSSTAGAPALTLDDYKRELDEARDELGKAQQMLTRHRAAVVSSSDDGRLDGPDIDHFELVSTICRNKIGAIEDHLRTLAEAAAAQAQRSK